MAATGELKPCPFCGGEPRTAVKDYGDTQYWRIYCDTIDCAMGVSCVYRSEAELIEAWNTRVETVTVVTGITTVTETPQITYVPELTCKNVDDEFPFFKCSECGCNAVVGYGGSDAGLPNYCPNCGARVLR